MNIAEKDIGGAQVRRLINTFDSDGKPVVWRAGMHLTGDQVRAVRRANRDALISSGALDVYRANPGSDPQLARENADLKNENAKLREQLAALANLESLKPHEIEPLEPMEQENGVDDDEPPAPPPEPDPEPEPEPEPEPPPRKPGKGTTKRKRK